MNAKVISIQVGLPAEVAGEKPWMTGIIKDEIGDPLWLGATNLVGDGQADLVHHGGAHKAVCAYSAVHYPYWRAQLEMPTLVNGSFGENFTIDELTEDDVCIGDVWNIGDASVEVSQPRQPCWKLAKRWGIKDLALQVQQTGRTGWYFRVLKQGLVQSGLSLALVERPNPHWTIAAANHVMHQDRNNLVEARRLAAVSTLSPSWKSTLDNRVAKRAQLDESKRLQGSDGTL